MTPRRRRQLTLISPVTHSSPQYFITLVEVMRKDKKQVGKTAKYEAMKVEPK